VDRAVTSAAPAAAPCAAAVCAAVKAVPGAAVEIARQYGPVSAAISWFASVVPGLRPVGFSFVSFAAVSCEKLPFCAFLVNSMCPDSTNDRAQGKI
jgi:hypothetical protein